MLRPPGRRPWRDRNAVCASLVSRHGVSESVADRWCDSWEKQARIFGQPPSPEFWDQGMSWILAEIGAGRKPFHDPSKPRDVRFTPAAARQALGLANDGHSLAAICEALGISEGTMRTWRKNHSDWNEALGAARDRAQFRDPGNPYGSLVRAVFEGVGARPAPKRKPAPKVRPVEERCLWQGGVCSTRRMATRYVLDRGVKYPVRLCGLHWKRGMQAEVDRLNGLGSELANCGYCRDLFRTAPPVETRYCSSYCEQQDAVVQRWRREAKTEQ